ncbi:bifunctional diguanylate cyclase/phosphodiesterase [Gorillibacterium sp. CAU 1737]|uniref:putative bifunctional diguanylate cyclase/phosphodiesterase n=1 Tax=Gorillibacterium sp. CAU 1737 TaxID=3140362 RepID=UPI003260B955
MRHRSKRNDFSPSRTMFGRTGILKHLPNQEDYVQSVNPNISALRIAGVYSIIGVLWILLSDRFLVMLVDDKRRLQFLSVAKGWLFVFLTAGLLFVLIRRTLNGIKKTDEQRLAAYRSAVLAHEELEQAYEEIIATEEELRIQYEQLEDQQHRIHENENKLEFLAYHDSMTGLPNKQALFDRSKQGLAEGCYGALLFLDIDNFKYINDTMGHEIGNALIVGASERLQQLIGHRGELYQFGGDEFVFLFSDLGYADEAERLANMILLEFRKALPLDRSEYHIGFSIGISLYPSHERDVMELVQLSEIAMYRAKESGKGTYVLYDEGMTRRYRERMIIEKHLHEAKDKDEFYLVYQPQFNMKANRVTGLEALMRWKSAALGEISPGKFIEIAEDSHLIIPLGAWVLRGACRELKRLRDLGHVDVTMSVNISLLQLMQPDFCQQVMETLLEYRLPPECLELELTESLFMESYDAVVAKLNVLRKANIRIALDDFGTGYSSLSYLTHLPITTLKIDKSFIDTLLTDRNQSILVEQIIQIGKRIGMGLVAEGVEWKEQGDRLSELGCETIQGYLFSRPLPSEQVETLLAAQTHTIE